MSFADEPLEIWLMRDEAEHEVRLSVRRKESLVEMQAALDQLQEMLDHPPAKGVNLMDSRVYGLGIWSRVRLPPEEITRAEELYRRVYTTGGPGTTYVQEGLLFIIGASCQPASIPFWLETLNLSRPRDSFSTKRRKLALAALAYLAAHDNAESEGALAHCTQHVNADIRAQAVFYWGEIYLTRKRTLPESVAAAMLDIARNDAAFNPRFQAREILHEMELPVPFDNPHGVYACKVKFKGAKSIYRTIELRSEQTLEDLHLAIQQAIHWDNDHLYSFYMNGVKYGDCSIATGISLAPPVRRAILSKLPDGTASPSRGRDPGQGVLQCGPRCGRDRRFSAFCGSGDCRVRRRSKSRPASDRPRRSGPFPGWPRTALSALGTGC